jgi:hypothetical protein
VSGLRRTLATGTAVGSVSGKANVAARAPNLGSDPFGWTCLDYSGESRPGMRGKVVCLITQATFWALVRTA